MKKPQGNQKKIILKEDYYICSHIRMLREYLRLTMEKTE